MAVGEHALELATFQFDFVKIFGLAGRRRNDGFRDGELKTGDQGADRYAAMMTKLEQRQAELSALPVRPELVEWSL